MALSIGIVGLPNVGKSTLFNALTENTAEALNYPFCTIDPNIGIVTVPDERLNKLARISQAKKIIPTTIEFVDIAGLVKGAHKGEGLGNKFLSHIRECDAICEVVRVFHNDNIKHVSEKIDPLNDHETISTELLLADLKSVTKILDRLNKEVKSGDKKIIANRFSMERAKDQLEKGLPLRDLDLSKDEKEYMRTFNFLSQKPIMYILNNNNEEDKKGYSWPGRIISLNIKQEEEISQLEKKDRQEFIEELGLKQSGLDKLVKAAYGLLDLITFFTTGPDETRAWTLKKGKKAPAAAGKIHSDFEQGFIRAEIINSSDFIKFGGEQATRNKGLLRTEGKDYVIQDGDICNFLFSK